MCRPPCLTLARPVPPFPLQQGASKVFKTSALMIFVYSLVAGAGAAVIGGLVGVPLLLRARKKWDQTM